MAIKTKNSSKVALCLYRFWFFTSAHHKECGSYCTKYCNYCSSVNCSITNILAKERCSRTICTSLLSISYLFLSEFELFLNTKCSWGSLTRSILCSCGLIQG